MPEHPLRARLGMRCRTGSQRWFFVLLCLTLATGCTYRGREATDDTVRGLAGRPYDQLPDQLRDKTGSGAGVSKTAEVASSRKAENAPAAVTPGVPTDVHTTALMEAAQDGKQPPGYQLRVPDAIPGSEAPLVNVPVNNPVAMREALRKLYVPLPPLPEEVKPLPGPNGRPYTLSDLQRIAAENSPILRQAASDVQAARGNMIQAATYPNPNVTIAEQPSNNNATGGAFGAAVDQVVVTGGKIRLATAAAKKALENAELALKRARSDLATSVRSNYYALLVSQETMRVTRSLSVLTDEVYRVQLTLAEKGGLAAAYEPAALRAQAYSARLAYLQATATYVYNWKQLVAAVGVRQLPLSEVAGRIDAAVPYYEYDRVLAQVLQAHTDVLTARNGIHQNRYVLKTNQIAPLMPNLDVQVGMYKDRVLNPLGTYHTFAVSMPLPIWDQNRGNILAAEAALARAMEEPHRVEMALTNTLANNFTNYKTNLDAVEYYRRYILPDQVRAYRGVLQRRQIDQGAQFGDLVQAQQTLATSVTTYLGLLGTLWSSVVSVADLLQTDDLFQAATPMPLPTLPDLDSLVPLPCCHPFGETGAAKPAPSPAPRMPVPAPTGRALPPPYAGPVTMTVPPGPGGPAPGPSATGGVPSAFSPFSARAAAQPASAPAVAPIVQPAVRTETLPP
ncbi:TolC family protein [Frigoriglobus tundricola]|uniref:Heavy metal RND efflux outer membrane protein, CzcC family n=1 Tax=Frigoriglobus tundricola TaxID=2774151 RepID=A0A6M5Z1E2_9BACT|nr:TolC family protein [Frigoriglobus tundricola]QJX00160.1 hypothetical protein FTUN_7784 [Frigoriglobus tundricola]